jgi:uncharacterized membrane protein
VELGGTVISATWSCCVLTFSLLERPKATRLPSALRISTARGVTNMCGLGIWELMMLLGLMVPVVVVIVIVSTRKRRPPAPPQGQQGTQPVSVADEIEKLNQLREQGVLTEEEFNKQKATLLDGR